MAYSGLAQAYGYNQGTAVYYSATYLDSANAPCNLSVSSADGGSIFIKDATGAVIYQQPAPPSLYAFTGITFNSCGIYGRLGPELSFCTSSYRQYGAWTSNTAFFNVSNGVQAWTVPASGSYRQSPITLLTHTGACPGAAACMHASVDITS